VPRSTKTEALLAAERSGLIARGEPLLVMLSGGADSVCLLDVALRLGARVSALHVNYGLRGPESAGDEEFCRSLCDGLGVALQVEQVALTAGAGNLQACARQARYAAAERVAAGDFATGHTASDQAETVLYRLVSSPGRRGLLGMAQRRGRLVRPLLGVTRAHTREHCREAGLEWREDSSNLDPRFARARIRHEVLPVLERISPGASETIAETARLLGDEAEVLEAVVDQALTDELERLRELPPALARLVLRRLAGAPVSRCRADEILRARGGSASVDVGGGLRAVVEYGRVRFTGDPAPAPPAPVSLPVPGSVLFGDWRVEARAGSGGLDPAALGESVTVRSWRAGDRMHPAGLGGSKKLQDLFTDRKVPREERRLVPVVEAGGEIAWVAGVAADERFRAPEGAPAVVLSATRSHS
jgi:tRNA(Ile)-lysidine synthase